MTGIHSSTRTFSYYIPTRPASKKKEKRLLFSAIQLSLGIMMVVEIIMYRNGKQEVKSF